MPSAFELLEQSQPQPVEAAPVDNSPGQFQQGLRSGFYGAGSQLQSLAGGVGEAVGANDFAQSRYQAAREMQAEAAASAPNVSSYKDVHDLRSGYDYLTGLAGQSIPAMAAGVGGGMLASTPVGRVIGATLATAPFEAGDEVQRQQNDPTAMQAPADERLLHAVGGGLVSAGANAVLPGIVAGKLAGGVAGAERGVGATLAKGLRELPESAAVGGAGAAVGEYAKQRALQLDNPSAQIDPEAIQEAGVGGLVVGAGAHGVGVAGETAHAAARAPANALSGAVKGARDAVASGASAAREKLGGVADSVAGKVSDAADAATNVDLPDPASAVRGIYDKTTQNAREFLDRVAQREDVADLRAVAGKTAEQVKEMLPTLDSERVQKIRDAADELLNKAGLDEDRRQQIVSAMQDLTDRGNQAVVAGIKKGVDATSAFASKAKALYDEFKKRPIDVSSRVVPDDVLALPAPKKSEDFSGIREAIAQEIVPALQKANPDIFTNSKALGQAADGVRMAVEHFKSGGELSSTQVARLIDTFGDQTATVLDSVHRAMGKVSPAENEQFYGALNELRAQQREQDKTFGLMQRSLLPELQDTTRTSDIRSELNVLRQAVQHIDTSTAHGKFQWETLKFDLDSRYGSSADKILAAIEKETRPKRNVLDKEEDMAHLTEHEHSALGDAIFYGPEKGGLAMHPDLDPAGDKGQARQAMARAEKQNPDRSVRFLTADELGHDHPDVAAKIKELQAGFIEAGKDAAEATRLAKEAVKSYGMAAAEGKSEPGTITKDNVKQVQVKSVEDVGRSKYDQPSVFKAGTTAYDAIALTKMMDRQFKGERVASDEKGVVHRNARMFMEGVAALQDHLGKHFEVADSTVIDHKGTTVGDVKKMGFAPPNLAGERLQAKIESLRRAYARAQDEQSRKTILQEAQDTLDHAKSFDPRMDIPDMTTEGQHDTDPFGNVHEALKGMTEPDAKIRDAFEKGRERGDRSTQQSRVAKNEGGPMQKGAPVEGDADTAAKSGAVKGTADVLRDKLQGWMDKPPSAGAKEIARKGLELLDNKAVLSAKDKKGLAALLSEGTKASQVAGTISALHEKYSAKFEGKDASASAPAKAETKAEAPKSETKISGVADHAMDKEFAKESYPDFKTADEAKKYLLDAYKRWGELAAEDRRVMDAENHPTNELPDAQRAAFMRMSELFSGDSHADLGSFLPGDTEMSSHADKAIRAYLKSAAPEVAGQVPKYFRSLEGTGTQRVDAQALQDVRAYVDKVLGPTVKTALAKIPHAGEYVNDTIRLSVHALNPMTVAYHEALHAFFDKLSKQGNGDVARVLERAAMAAPIQNQLRTLLAGEHAALAQLRTPEEAAAYMYQFWAAGKLKVGGATGNLFARVKEAIARVLGVWTNDRRAEVIMDYFHSGEFKTSGMGQTSAVAKALMQAGRNEILDKARAATKPLADVADALSTAGSQRLRDTGVPALRQLADLMKVTGREGTDDHGFIPAARTERTRVMNEFGAKLRGFTQAHFEDALEAMQAGREATTPEGRLVQREVQGAKGLLPTMLEYMRSAGVDVDKIQPSSDYFPRLYDAHYISRHQDEFKTVLERHGLSSKEADAITLNLMATNGAEFTIETDRPGMQFTKRRALGHIPDAELASFMRKNMFEILGSYVGQATRRAEWARRFGDDGQGIVRILRDAKQQGATDAQLDTARKFVRAVDGTLGDTLSPTARRLMGNMIVYQNWRLLPLAAFSSVVDPLGIIVRGGTVRDAWTTFARGIKEIPSSFKNDFKADADTHLAASIGVIDDAMLADATSQVYMQGMVGDTAKKINDALFRYNLMEGFNRSMRVGATQAAIKFLERHADGTASPHSVRWLSELGLEPGVRVDMADPRVRAAVNQWVDGAVLRPDAADKPIWMNDPHYMLFSHLKQFVYAFQETILKRVAHEFTQGNYAPVMALSAYVPVMIASDLIKGLIQGGGQLPEWKKEWGPADYLGSGIERAGLLGKAQFPMDGPGMMMGPTGQQALGLAEALDGKAPSKAFLKALPAETLYSGWLGDGGTRVENSMSVD